MVRAEQTCTEVEELLARDDLDAVYVAVPNAFHEEVAVQALQAGKHVLLDKPFALNTQAAENIVAAAEAAGRTLMLGMNQRFERNVQSAKALIADGRLGDVYHLKAFWRRRAGIPRMGSWFTNKSVSGGGALLDIGVHVLDVAMHLIDNFRPVSVSGATFTRFGNRGLGEGRLGPLGAGVRRLRCGRLRYRPGASGQRRRDHPGSFLGPAPAERQRA